MKRATMILKAYIKALSIDNFVFPVETSTTLFAAVVPPQHVIDAVENGAITIERDKGELFARLKRVYTATTVCPIWQPVAMYATPYRRLRDIPKYHNSVARGWELVVCETIPDTEHKGDDINSVDGISKKHGKLEMKTGRGKFKKEGKAKS